MKRRATVISLILLTLVLQSCSVGKQHTANEMSAAQFTRQLQGP